MSPLALSLRLLQAQPDERLLVLARGGHEPAFEALVRRYRTQLLAYCRKVAAPQASAEDILQQALMQAWRALAAGVEVHDARAWLYRIVRNAAISATRKVGEDPAQLSHEISAEEVEQVVEQRLAAREALAGLAALPELQREVMLGTAVEGRSHEEVAASLGLTSGSVRGLLYRARSTLRAAAAALIPAPLIEWAIRQEPATHGSRSAVVEAIAGGGSAGVAGAVLKGGAVVTVAGALAGTAAVVVTRHLPSRSAPAHAAVAHGPPKRRMLALVAGPSVRDASAESGIAEPTGLGTETRHQLVRLRVGGDRVPSPARSDRIDSREASAHGQSRSEHAGSGNAGSGRSDGSDRNDGARRTGGQGPASSPTSRNGVNDGSDSQVSRAWATAASPREGDRASASQPDAGSAVSSASGTSSGSGTGTSAGTASGTTGSEGTSTARSQPSQPVAATPSAPNVSATGSE